MTLATLALCCVSKGAETVQDRGPALGTAALECSPGSSKWRSTKQRSRVCFLSMFVCKDGFRNGIGVAVFLGGVCHLNETVWG